MAKKKPDDIGDIDRALDRLTTAIIRHHTKTEVILSRIERKLDALIASGVTDPGILKSLTADLAQSEQSLSEAVKAATPTTEEMPKAE